MTARNVLLYYRDYQASIIPISDKVSVDVSINLNDAVAFAKLEYERFCQCGKRLCYVSKSD